MKHPIEDPNVQQTVKATTKELLDHTGGSGQVSVEFDFKDYKTTRVYVVTKSRKKT